MKRCAHLRVQRRLRDLPMTPEAAHNNRWRVEVRCAQCPPPPRAVELDPRGRFQAVWTEDWEEVFARGVLVCRRHQEAAEGLKVREPGRDHYTTLL